MAIRFPTKHDHLVIIGKNGSGKTLAGLWHLRIADHSIPWIIIDYKGDKNISLLDPVPFDKVATMESGNIYRYSPLPNDPDVENVLWDLWRHEDVGIFIDESYMVPNGDAINAILTQGRSKSVPVIALTQRPVYVPRFFFSEANFFQTFWLNDERDRKLVTSFQPAEVSARLPRYHSYYYDVNNDDLKIMLPVPLPNPPQLHDSSADSLPITATRRINVV